MAAMSVLVDEVATMAAVDEVATATMAARSVLVDEVATATMAALSVLVDEVAMPVSYAVAMLVVELSAVLPFDTILPLAPRVRPVEHVHAEHISPFLSARTFHLQFRDTKSDSFSDAH
jgi:hypothetical protein